MKRFIEVTIVCDTSESDRGWRMQRKGLVRADQITSVVDISRQDLNGAKIRLTLEEECDSTLYLDTKFPGLRAVVRGKRFVEVIEDFNTVSNALSIFETAT
jgi:hypothetical protein